MLFDVAKGHSVLRGPFTASGPAAETETFSEGINEQGLMPNISVITSFMYSCCPQKEKLFVFVALLPPQYTGYEAHCGQNIFRGIQAEVGFGLLHGFKRKYFNS